MHAFTKATLLSTSLTVTPLTVMAQDTGEQQFENPKFAETVIAMGNDCNDVSTPNNQLICAKAIANQTYDMASHSIVGAAGVPMVNASVIHENCVANVGDTKGSDGSDSIDPLIATKALLGYANQCLTYGYQTITDTGLGTPNIQDYISGFPASAKAAQSLFGFSADDMLSAVFNEQRYNMLNLGSAVMSPVAFYPNGEYNSGRDKARQQIQGAYPEIFAVMPPR